MKNVIVNILADDILILTIFANMDLVYIHLSDFMKPLLIKKLYLLNLAVLKSLARIAKLSYVFSNIVIYCKVINRLSI